MKKIYLLLMITLLSANDLKITHSYAQNGDIKFAMIELSWKNSWKNAKNHDAVWLFMKSVNSQNRWLQHLYVKENGHQWEKLNKANYQIKIEVSDDGSALMISPKNNYRGDIHIRLKVIIDESKFGRLRLSSSALKVFALEMVYIPESPFYVGDAKVDSSYASFYKSGLNGQFDGLYHVSSESMQINIGRNPGDLYYLSNNQYQGDQKGFLSKDFPKGVAAFYIMKYEPKQGEYVDFLNSLSIDDSQARANFAGKNYYRDRGSIRIENNRYVADKRERPNNFVSWDDGMAYADWAALRPMTELEFTKASNGPNKPISKQFPWGTKSIDKIQRRVDLNGDLRNTLVDESKLNDKNLDQFAASYYWVMDLSGSLWERVVTIGDSVGRSFKGSHGDGRLGEYGFASNKDWPYGWGKPAGYGFRGGGFYTHFNAYHSFNPYSTTAVRPFGAYKGGLRKNSYGVRFVRTANSLKEMK